MWKRKRLPIIFPKKRRSNEFGCSHPKINTKHSIEIETNVAENQTNAQNDSVIKSDVNTKIVEDLSVMTPKPKILSTAVFDFTANYFLGDCESSYFYFECLLLYDSKKIQQINIIANFFDKG